MKFLRDATWEEVFQGWKEREANNPGWIRCATEIKGWSDWESWRRFSASQIGAEKREWQIFQFTDPLNEVPQMLVGPYSGWQSDLPEKNVTTFEALLTIPAMLQKYQTNLGVRSMIDALPFSTEMIGLIRDDHQKIVLLDGHHRATAIALAKREGKPIDFDTVKITIALAHLKKEEISLLDNVLARGSSRKP